MAPDGPAGKRFAQRVARHAAPPYPHPLLSGRLAILRLSWREVLSFIPEDRTVVKGLLAVVWVGVGAVVGALLGMAVGGVAGAAVSAVVSDTSNPNDDVTGILVGSMVAVGCTVIGAI